MTRDMLGRAIAKGDTVAFAHQSGRTASLSLRRVEDVDEGAIKVRGLHEGARAGWTTSDRVVVISELKAYLEV